MKFKKIIDESLTYDLIKSIQNNISHGFISTDTDGLIISVNNKATEMLGYTDKELVGKETPALFHDKDEVISRSKEYSEKFNIEIEPGFKTFICHSEHKLKNEFRWTYIHKDGTKFPVMLSISEIKNKAENVIGYLGIVQDLTDQQKLETQLLNKHKSLEIAQSISKLGSWSFDVKSGIISWSKEMFNIFPENIEDGEPDFDKHKSTIHPDDVDHWLKTVGECTESGEPYLMRFRTHKLNDKNSVVWVEARGRGELVEGEIVSLSGTCQDVTELVLKEEELERKAKALSKAERVKAEFLANMSHEIRTPLNGIIGLLDILKYTKLDINQREILDTISISSDSLLILLSDILDLSKIEAEVIEIEKRSFNLSKLIQAIANLMSPKAALNGSKIDDYLSDKNDTWILGDEARIRQILMKFVSNAIKFTKDGLISIDLSFDKKGGDELIKLTVKDNGVGIKNSQQEKIFNAFQQADTSITRQFGGTGLGLSISSKLASLMGAKIELSSTFGEGSSFSLVMDYERGEPTEIDIQEYKFDSSIGLKYPHKILLAEDNIINQKVTSLNLKKFGYNCDIVSNGLEALEKIYEVGIDYYTIILMDVQMPELDGISTTQEILKKWGNKVPKIIALTANAFKEDRKKYLSIGMDDYLSKPLNKKNLIELLIKYYVK